MKINRAHLPCALLVLLTPVLTQAQTCPSTGTYTTCVVGNPADDELATPTTQPSPNLGGPLLTFSNLTDNTIFSSYSSQGITISSPDGLQVQPYSDQSNPNFLQDLGYDGSLNGYANVTISVANGVGAIGFGIADGDYIDGNPEGSQEPIYLQPLTLTDGVLTDLGPAFEVTTPACPNGQTPTCNPYNGYYVIEDSTPSQLYGVEITDGVSINDDSGDYGGLAIADVQVTPEPSAFLLLAGGIAALASRRILKRR